MPTVCQYMLCLFVVVFVHHYVICCVFKILLAHLEYGETQFGFSVHNLVAWTLTRVKRCASTGERPGAMTPMDYKYSLLTPAPPDDYGQGPVLLLHTDTPPGGLFAVLEVRRGDVAAWHRSALGFLNRLKVCSFMCFLTVTFLVTASYMLLADRKGLLLTPPPYRFGSPVSPVSPVSPAAGDFNLSATRDLAHVRLVVKSIVARVEFQSSRRLPERKALVSSEPHVSESRSDGFTLGTVNRQGAHLTMFTEANKGGKCCSCVRCDCSCVDFRKNV